MVDREARYFANKKSWKNELALLRKIVLSTGLEETFKWNSPVYTIEGKNIVGLAAFKSYVGLWFFQGALLKDIQGVLENAQEGKTQALRQWRFSSIDTIDEVLIIRYIKEAITNQQQGKRIVPKTKPLIVPAELKAAFKSDQQLETAFNRLGLTKRRDYCEYIGEAKRPETISNRLSKIIPMIYQGRGLNDKYK